MSLGGLDDLFAGGYEPRPEEPAEPVAEGGRSPWWGWLLRTVLLVGVATTVAQAVLRSQGIAVSLLLVIAAFLALRLLMLAVSRVTPPPVPRGGYPELGRDGPAGDSMRAAVRRWERALSWSESDPAGFSRNVLPVLGELADERLRLRHGITRATDPRRARELLGDELWQFLADPDGRPPKARQLTGYVESLERL